MYAPEEEPGSDEKFVLDIYVDPVRAGGSEPARSRLLRIVRDYRTRGLELVLPEQSEVASTGWVPEIAYNVTDTGYVLSAVVRPVATLSPVRRMGEAPETEAPPADGVLYEVTFKNRDVCVNGFRLSRPTFNSENELVFEHLFRNPNRRVGLEEIEGVLGRPLTKKLRDVVRDLGFSGSLRDMFFPGVSKTAIQFTNPVTRGDFETRGLRAPQLEIR